MISTAKIFGGLFQGIAPRQKDILVRRFGLSSGKPMTLAALGDEYGVTRERIRQIEAAALGALKGKILVNKECGDLIARGTKYLKAMGGVAPEDRLLAHYMSFTEGMTGNYLALLAEAGQQFSLRSEDEAFNAFYYVEKPHVKASVDFTGRFIKLLRNKKDEVLKGKYDVHFKDFVKSEKMDPKIGENYLATSKSFFTNRFGHTGLAEWPEINPRTVRDRIYLVLERHGAPLHFEGIAQAINDAKIGGRKALAPTVHNELIKDKRFVLVGRGMYGLSEHGFEPGTAKEVIKKILKKKGPLTAKDVMNAVQKERFFKPNTVLANLQNKNLFERLEGGRYRVREA